MIIIIKLYYINIPYNKNNIIGVYIIPHSFKDSKNLALAGNGVVPHPTKWAVY